MENVVRELRHDFTAAISSDQNDVTLDPSMAKLSEKTPDFLGPFSIYSRGQLRKMGDFLSHISNARLKGRSNASGDGRGCDPEIVRRP